MVEETLSDLKKLASKGPIKAVSSGSNSVGKTLQAALGIEHSTTSRNYYKGFTITSTAANASSRTNLFAQVPDWQKSPVTSSKKMVDLYGIEDETGKYQKKLFCTVNALKPNTFNLILKVDQRANILSEWHSSEQTENEVVTWDSKKLFSKLLKQDRSVVLSATRHKKTDGDYFHFQYAEFYLSPSFERFLQQIEFGGKSVDHLIALKSGTATEKGPLFKVTKNAREDLFGDYKKFNLLD